MSEEEIWYIVLEAYDRASRVLGCDPGYYGDEGDKEVERQLEEMGYNKDDFVAKKEFE